MAVADLREAATAAPVGMAQELEAGAEMAAGREPREKATEQALARAAKEWSLATG
jgi:hypothetical protein